MDKNVCRQRLLSMPDAKPLVFDVGAHIGQTIQEIRTLSPNAEIHSFEPDPRSFAELEDRFKGTPGLHLNNVGLSDRKGTAAFHRNNKSYTNSFLKLKNSRDWRWQGDDFFEETNADLPLTTIDNYCSDHGVKHIDFLKIDTQGLEPECLAGARDMLAAGRITAIETEIIFDNLYERRSSFHTVEQTLLPHEYRLVGMSRHLYDSVGILRELDALYIREDRLESFRAVSLA